MTKPVPGARVVPRPVASSPAEAATDEFWQRCRRADREQAAENLKAQRAGTDAAAAAPVVSPAQPGAAPPRSASTDDRPGAFDQGMDAGAAYAKALLSGRPTPGGASSRPAPIDSYAAEERGAGAARDVIAIAGQPGSHRQDAPGAATGSDAAAGAAEARRLLGIG